MTENTTINLNIEKAGAASAAAKNEGLFCKDILNGLQCSPKHLPSKYFYDTIGDQLFQAIMECEEYYPFDCELEIFRESTAQMAKAIASQGGPFDLIELGAGDCTKSTYLLRHLVETKTDFTYMPIDISKNMIDYLHVQLPLTIPGIRVNGLNGEYFPMLEKASLLSGNRKVILFLGSNLGNMLPEQALVFLRDMQVFLRPGDLVIIGLDLKKHPATILAAYNDKGGITRDFNLNLLHRINRELKANFDVTRFQHYPVYDPQTGSCKSYLVSLCDQTVTIHVSEGAKKIHFHENEEILMEISQKYTRQQVQELGQMASFKTIEMLFDSRNWFVDAIWQV